MGAPRLTLKVMGGLCAVLSAVALLSASAEAATVPAVVRESSDGVGYTEASLHAQINQGDEPTSYHFEYGSTESYGDSAPLSDEAIGSAPNETEVSQVISKLAAGSPYHYRLVATNAVGTTYGPDRSFETYAKPSEQQADSCPNASLRASGLSASLPDCRAYEMVSPVDKNGADVSAQTDSSMASASGDAITYSSRAGFGDTEGSGTEGNSEYVAFRGAGSWSTYAVTPTPAQGAFQILAGGTVNRIYSPELTSNVLEAYDLPGAASGVTNGINYYRENTLSKKLETLTSPQAGIDVLNPRAVYLGLRGTSADLDVVVFETEARFLFEAPGSSHNLYAMDHGILHLVGVLPDGTIPAGGSAAPRDYWFGVHRYNDTVSSDGSRIFFMSPADESTAPQLYMREREEKTFLISESEASSPVQEPHNVRFQGETDEGHQVIFSTVDRLLDVDPGGAGYGIYRYTTSPHPEAESNLTFIARVESEPEVVGMSEQADRIYFAAGETLYFWEQGLSRIVAESFVVYNDTESEVLRYEGGRVNVSSDGRHIAFYSQSQLTSQATDGRLEMYLYDAPTGTLKCVSCLPDGSTPKSGIDIVPKATEQLSVFLLFPHHFLSSDGRLVFFSTADALVPQDTNKLADVYEYDANTGKVALLTSGEGGYGAWFADADPMGKNVFFVTKQPYSRLDTDTLVDLYDARVGGGLPEPPRTPVPCAGDECQGIPATVPSFSTLSSGFTGLGNIVRESSVPTKAKHRLKKHKAKLRHVKKHIKKRGKAGRHSAHRTGR
jgi:hypothetical protein